jgi:hypothetical protein
MGEAMSNAKFWMCLAGAVTACATNSSDPEVLDEVAEVGLEQLDEPAEPAAPADAVPLAAACGESAANLGWFSAAVPAHRDTLVAEVHARVHEPAYEDVDMVLGFGAGTVDALDKLAANVRFNRDGYVDARNGDTDEARSAFRFDYDHLYAVRFEIDVANRRYSAFIRTYDTPGPGDPIALDFAFRTEQGAASQLDDFAHLVDSPTGSLYGCVRELAP